MCGRYSLTTPIPDLAELFHADPSDIGERPARFNIAPTEDIVVVRPGAGGRALAALRWGLVPNWAEDPEGLPLMINARSESLAERPAFRDLLPERRCAVPADGFYEWRTEGGIKQPYFVRRRDGRPMALAGLWDVWRGGRDPLVSCTVVTGPANELLAPLHDRMPILLDGDHLETWLDPELGDPARAQEALGPTPPGELEAYPVSRRVNRIANDDPDCVQPEGAPIRSDAEWEDRTPEPDQLGLF